MMLPAGSYSALALSGSPGSASGVYASLTAVDLVRPTAVSLTPVGAISSRFQVGSVLPGGTLFPAAAAQVSVSVGPNGPTVQTLADAAGSVAFYLPASLSSQEYCLHVASAGFVSRTTCNLSPSGLAALQRYPVSLANVSVTLTVVGLPSGTSVTVNLTAESPTAQSLSLTGGPTFSFSAPPGNYGVGANATVGNGTVYLPASVLSTTLPLGATTSTITLGVLPQVTAKGTLDVVVPAPLANVTVSLSSPLLNITVNGTAFENGFHAAPGAYSADVRAEAGGSIYTNLTRVTVATDGTISPTLRLDRTAVTVRGTLVDSSGTALALNGTVTLVGPNGVSASAPASKGSFSADLPPSTVYRVFANGTGLFPGPNGSYYRIWTVTPGATCTVPTSASACAVPVVPTTLLVWLNGSLVPPTGLSALNGAVRAVGPYPSVNVTTIPVSNGVFSARVLPGAYSLYASSGASGAALSGLSSALVLGTNGTAAPVAVTLEPTWLATISLSPTSGSTGIGPVTLTVRDAAGLTLVYAGLSPSSSVSVALPTGAFVASAIAGGLSYGVPSNVSGSVAFSVTSGNVGATVPLAYDLVRSVSGSVAGPASVTVRAGGSGSFAFGVRNSGNVPVTIHPVGSPAYWSFGFSFSNVTLQPGASYSASVTIGVPSGTAVAHPPVSIAFAVANGTDIGFVSPSPVVNVVGYYGVGLGPASSPAQIGPNRTLVPFYVVDSGNLPEYVQLSVADASQLAALGWNATVLNVRQEAGAGLANLTAGENQTFFVQLNASGPAFVAPLRVTVGGTVLNASGAVTATVVLSVGTATVKTVAPPGSSGLTVGGPSLGSPSSALPVWLVPLLAFLPAIALAVGVYTYRWWRTRRWTRR